MKIAQCGNCRVKFKARSYRVRPDRVIYCSLSCAKTALFASGYRAPWSKSDELLEKAREMYCRTGATLDAIAENLNISRSSVCGWARKYGWKKFERITSVRCNYRKAAAKKLGRELKLFEQVHHIDGDLMNNDPENIHVYPTASAHSIAHATLEKCAFAFFKAGLIRFDHGTGIYEIVRRPALLA